MENIYKHIRIDEGSLTPKYIQLAECILNAIKTDKLKRGHLLPSINKLSFELNISRDTAEKAYGHLKKIGVLGSIPGKGCFIAKTNHIPIFKIFFLIDKLSANKKAIYDALVSVLGERATIDLHIYNNDYTLFKKLLTEKKEYYTHCIIIPHFTKLEENAHEIINQLRGVNLLVLDKNITGINRPFSAVFENYEKDIFHALEQARLKLKKYQTLKIIFPKYTYFPPEVLKGFLHFCSKYTYKYKVIHSIADEPIKEGDVYINLLDDDLVKLLDMIQHTNFKVGKDIGIISYNETPLKRFIFNGITTISTNFKQMGESAAKLILNNENRMQEIPFTLTLRPSL
jgi:DNA-binding transcriptional regulator YhcF (GntR family)